MERYFNQALEAADQLSLDEQETLIEILHRRMIERRRLEILRDVKDAEKAFQNREASPASPEDLMKEILS